MFAEKITENVPQFDENGLLKDPSMWNESVAQSIADNNTIGPLTEDHWRIIHALRAHCAKYGVPPAMALLCRKQGMDVNCVQKLFCTCLNAWRVAGLSDPGEEAKSYMSAM